MLTRDLGAVLAEASGGTWAWGMIWGVIWGVGGLTYGLSVRFLGVSLGSAIALGLCTVFGMLMPPLFERHFRATLWDKASGFTVLIGLAVCLFGIALTGMAGVSKERGQQTTPRNAAIQEFNFAKGLLVAIVCGLLSAAFSYGLTATKEIHAIGVSH